MPSLSRSIAAAPALALALALALPACARVSAEDAATVERLAAEAEGAAAQRDAAWRDAMTAAVRGAVGPRPDLGPCAVPIGDVSGLALFGGIEANLDALGLGDVTRPSGVAVARDGQVPKKSPRRRQLDFDLREIRERKAAYERMRGPELVAETKRVTSTAGARWDALVVVARSVGPGRVDPGAKTFEAGANAGRVFVYDYGADKVACAASFVATNSGSVKVRTEVDRHGRPTGSNADETLAMDLDVETVRAAFRQLVAAGPPKP